MVTNSWLPTILSTVVQGFRRVTLLKFHSNLHVVKTKFAHLLRASERILSTNALNIDQIVLTLYTHVKIKSTPMEDIEKEDYKGENHTVFSRSHSDIRAGGKKMCVTHSWKKKNEIELECTQCPTVVICSLSDERLN